MEWGGGGGGNRKGWSCFLNYGQVLYASKIGLKTCCEMLI